MKNLHYTWMVNTFHMLKYCTELLVYVTLHYDLRLGVLIKIKCYQFKRPYHEDKMPYFSIMSWQRIANFTVFIFWKTGNVNSNICKTFVFVCPFCWSYKGVNYSQLLFLHLKGKHSKQLSIFTRTCIYSENENPFLTCIHPYLTSKWGSGQYSISPSQSMALALEECFHSPIAFMLKAFTPKILAKPDSVKHWNV